MGLVRHLISLIRFIALPAEQRRVTFYSEGENYWPYLKALITTLLDTTSLTVNYISSSANDPGLKLEHERLNTFITDEGHIRNYLFENLATDIMVMTMPDLGSYQIKRSSQNVHYIYVQHSLVSLHMAYREGAFDQFDTVFCAGPHHILELEALKANRSLNDIKAIEHGYPRLDSILQEAANRKPKAAETTCTEKRHVLFAPTWGPQCAIESGAAEPIIAQLLNEGHKVTLRPHPQTTKLCPEKVNLIVANHENKPNFSYEANVSSQESLHASDVMISDWSGAALDYAFGLGKPVVFLDVPKKVNNPNYDSIDILPFEESIRTVVGTVCSIDNIELPKQRTDYDLTDYVYNPGDCATSGAAYIAQLATQLKKSATSAESLSASTQNKADKQ